MSLAPLRDFVARVTEVVSRGLPEAETLSAVRPLLAALVARDDWLPDELAQPHPQFYRQFLLHADPLERFSVVSFVWGPGQKTPVHDHTVWGLVGQLRGKEACREYAPDGPGRVVDCGREHTMTPGMVEAVSPTVGDWHVVSNARTDGDSVSIHVYGGNIGAVRRHRVDEASGAIVEFISGYSSTATPNLWDRSVALRAAPAR